VLSLRTAEGKLMMPSAGSPETALIPLPPMVPARGGMLPTRDLAAVRIQAGERVRELLEQATAENTKTAYAADWQHFTEWCTALGISALPGNARRSERYQFDPLRRVVRGDGPLTTQLGPPALSKCSARNSRADCLSVHKTGADALAPRVDSLNAVYEKCCEEVQRAIKERANP